jgi:hypothetical protein
MLAAWRRWVAGLVLGATAFGGCLSPTLPLPPPEEPDTIAQGNDGVWELRGDCLEGAEVIAINESTGRGAVFVDLKRSGRYSLLIEGDACDVAIISQVLSDEPSGEVRVVLHEVSGGLDVDPEACSQ